MAIMTRVGSKVLEVLGDDGEFIPCALYRKPLANGEKMVGSGCAPVDKKYIHFPEEQAIWSYGSGYGEMRCPGKVSGSSYHPQLPVMKVGWLNTCLFWVLPILMERKDM